MASKKFVKGQSGNPSGRPKDKEEISRLARSYSVKAIETLVKIMLGKTRASADAQARAASAILDRAIGKPTQDVDVKGKSGLVFNVNLGEEPKKDG